MKVMNDHCIKFSNLSNWKEEAWKNQGFNGIRTLSPHPTCRNTSQQGGQTHATCCTQQCCDHLAGALKLTWVLRSLTEVLSLLIHAILFPYVTLQGTMKIIEEYRNRTSSANPLECYYLFELNHDAACTVKSKHLSPGSICVIMWVTSSSTKLTDVFFFLILSTEQ